MATEKRTQVIGRRSRFGSAPSSLVFSFVILLGLYVQGCSQESQEQKAPARSKLNVYNWSNYIGRLTVPEFSTEFGIDVGYTTYSSNEELIETLTLRSKQYDVVFPSDNAVGEMIDEKLLAPLDHKLLPNLTHIDPRFRGLPYDPENKYCVPYNWGTTGIAVNTLRIKKKITGWDALWDEGFKGQVSILSEPRAGFLPALKRLGYSVNTTDRAELERARDLLIQLKPLLKAFSSDKYLDLLREGKVWIAVGYSGDVIKLKNEKPEIEYVIPMEGTDIWVDNICIPSASENRELAHKFINYLLRPEVAAEITNETGFATANLAAKKFIKPAVLTNPTVFPPEEILAKTEYAKGLGEEGNAYDELWEEVLKAPIDRSR